MTQYGDMTNYDATVLTVFDIPDYVGNTANNDSTTPERQKAACSAEDFKPFIRTQLGYRSPLYFNSKT